MENLFDLSKKIAIVTGGGSGLGRSMAIALASAGAKVIIVDINSVKGEEVANEITKIYKKSCFIKVNITKKAEIEKMTHEVIEKFGRIDVLVNSAGSAAKHSLLVDMEETEWDKVLDINLKGTFLTNTVIAKQMVKQKSGRIINIASMSGSIVNRFVPGVGVYCASKAGVIIFTKALAIELANSGVTANTISPCYMETPPEIKFWKEDTYIFKKQMDMIPMGRPGKPEELSGLIIYMASDNSSYVTGSDIKIDGGYTCW